MEMVAGYHLIPSTRPYSGWVKIRYRYPIKSISWLNCKSCSHSFFSILVARDDFQFCAEGASTLRTRNRQKQWIQVWQMRNCLWKCSLSVIYAPDAIHFRDLRPFWQKLGVLGAHGITVKSEYGGSDGNYLDHVIVMEELSRFHKNQFRCAIGLSIWWNSIFQSIGKRSTIVRRSFESVHKSNTSKRNRRTEVEIFTKGIYWIRMWLPDLTFRSVILFLRFYVLVMQWRAYRCASNVRDW